jgi:uncharacterized protein (DUF58 family)
MSNPGERVAGQAGMPSGQSGLPSGQAGMPSGQAGMPSGQAGMPSRRAGRAGRAARLTKPSRPTSSSKPSPLNRLTGIPRLLSDRARELHVRTEPTWGPIWRPVHRALRWVSPLGWGVAALGAASWWLGARYGWIELLMLGAATLVLLAACVLLAVGRTRVSIDAEVDPSRVVVGDPATGRVIVGNTGSVPILPLLVELPIGVSAARFVLPPLGSGTEHEELFVVPTHRRGVIPVGPARTVQGDPFGLVRRTVLWTEVTELFVHPRTVAIESLGAGLLRDLEGSVTEDQSMSDLAFHALREYQPGDDRRYIHWRSSAKAGRLLVRQFLDTRRSHITVLVDTDPASYRDGTEVAREIREITAGRTLPVPGGALPEVRDLETAISVAASIGMRCHRDDQDVTIVAGSNAVSKAHPQRTLDTLARVEAGPVDLLHMSTTANALAPDTSVCLVVTGPHREFGMLQRVGTQFPPEVRTIAIVVDPLAERSVRRAGSVTVLTVDALRNLRAVLSAGLAGA